MELSPIKRKIYIPHTTFIAEIAKRSWNFLQSKERLSLIFNKPPLVAYRRPKSLRDRLVRSRFVNETPQNFIPKGFRACERTKCSWCKKINQTTTFTSPNNNKTFTIFHTMDCQSSWIIYIIECNICKHQYIGKSETAFNLRLNNHRNHINHSALWANSWIDTWFFGLCLMLSGLGNFVVDCRI